MIVALAQVNTTVGDLEGNVKRCLDATKKGNGMGADLIVFPEMTIPGYPPRDILFDTSFQHAVFNATYDFAQRASGEAAILIGSLSEAENKLPQHPGLYNSAFFIHKQRIRLVANKQLLPIYDVFHEPRWFNPGCQLPPITINGNQVGVLICEDIWDSGYPVHPPAALKDAGATLLICLAASPYRKKVMVDRLEQARRTCLPTIFMNLVGATDELIFDGRSFVLNQKGECLATLKSFGEDLRLVDLDSSGPEKCQNPAGLEDEIQPALVLGIQDFARKNNLIKGFVGISGGVDSAVTACLAVEALGPKNVTGIMIPSRYTHPRSIENAKLLAERLQIKYERIELEPLHQATEKTLPACEDGTAMENIQARLRMVILMSYVNQQGGFLINTSNKTELATGYTTLYGDMAGALSPLGDLSKPEVYALARGINRKGKVIPDFILERVPTAELKPGQTDPFDYETLAPEVETLVNQNRSNKAMRLSEHKRWQMGVILKISEKSFGTGRMMPISRL